MSERWRRQLELIDRLQPPDSVIDSLPSGLPAPRARLRASARRRALPVLVLALAAASAVAVVLVLRGTSSPAGRSGLARIRRPPPPATLGDSPGQDGLVAERAPQGNRLIAVAASGPDDVWAVGQGTPRNRHGFGVSLVEHWDGTGWTAVDCPDVGPLKSVTAPAPGVMWAISGNGVIRIDAGGCRSVAPPRSARGRFLTAISADSAGDVWVAGLRSGHRYAKDTYGWNTLVARWTGAGWRVFTTPNATDVDNDLEAIVALSPDDVWAAGSYQSYGRSSRPLVLHWDGRSWRILRAAAPAGTDSGIGVLAGDPRTGGVWAFGQVSAARSGRPRPGLALHWSGRNWAPLARMPASSLNGMGFGAQADAIGLRSVWVATGSVEESAGLVYWDGRSWTESRLGLWPASVRPILTGVAATGPSDAWTVGFVEAGCSPMRAVIEHWNGSAWSVVPAAGEPSATTIATLAKRLACPKRRPSTPTIGY